MPEHVQKAWNMRYQMCNVLIIVLLVCQLKDTNAQITYVHAFLVN